MDNVAQGFVAGKDYVSCVSADNYGNGIIAADLIGEALNGKGKVGVIKFDVDFFVTNQRLEAFEKEMAEKYPNIEIVSKMGFTDQNACSEVADAMILEHPDLDAIFAHWDVPCEGVLSSLRAAGLNNIKLSTIDLGNNIAKEIAEGNVLGVGAQLPYDQGVAEATLAAYALLGKETPAYVAVPAMRVDQSNILEAYQTVYHIPAPDWLVNASGEKK
jgi:ribose transport system substrate-binding protein